jgi:hypothetical protein
MPNFYDTPFYCEDEFLLKVRNNLVNNFSLDSFSANDIALEILELLTLSDSNIAILNKYYVHNT